MKKKKKKNFLEKIKKGVLHRILGIKQGKKIPTKIPTKMPNKTKGKINACK